MVFVINMIWGCQTIDALFKRMGSNTLFESYTFFGCFRFLAMASAWPIAAPLLRKKVDAYEAFKREAVSMKQTSDFDL